MDDHGEVTGTVKITYVGAPALPWRHEAVTGDLTSGSASLSPTSDKQKLESFAVFDLSTEKASTSVAIRRNYVLGTIGFLPPEYPALRAFYTAMEAKAQESIVLTRTSSNTAGVVSPLR